MKTFMMVFKKLVTAVALLFAMVPVTAAIAAGDHARGRVVFARCAACHSIEPTRRTVGPTLAGVFGRKAGALPSFTYSPAMKKYGKVWDVATMDAFLAAPTRTVPGTKMVFTGLPNATDRADLIAYMRAAR